MARPKKAGLDYFPFDVDTFQDIKIRKLIKYQGGKAVAIYASLLCLIYKSGYYMRWDKELPFIISEMTGFEEAYISEVIKSCLVLGLFSKELFDSDGVLTSAGIQERYRSICKQLNRKCEFNEFSLISSQETGVSSQETGVSSQETGVSSQETGVSSEENPISSEKIPQRKGKEKKGKENKGKNIVYPYQDIADLWNSVCVSLPKIQRLNDNRRQKIKCRCDEWGKTPDVWLRTAEDIFRRMQASDFLKGTNGNGWVATFDWLFCNSGNSIKVMEGNYDNKRGAGAQQPVEQANLGVGEFIDKATGRRTYGSGKATIPQDAPPRPSDKHAWDAATSKWVLL